MIKPILLIIIFTISVFSQNSYIKLSFETDEGDKGSELTFGVHKDATFNLDNELGEFPTINAPPPAGYYIFTLLYFIDSVTYNQPEAMWGNLDLIPIPQDNYNHTHNFRVWLDGGRKFTITWDIVGDNIDSAKIQDINGGQFINIDLMNQESYYWNNENVSTLDLRLVVWYNNSISSVKKIEDEINIFPIPSNYFIYVDYDFERGELYDNNGKKLKDFYDKNVNTSELTSGVYFIRLYSNGLTLHKRFIVE